MKHTLERILKAYARSILRKYQPMVVGITGSVGKTSTKEAIFAVLSSHFSVQQTQKNYNNELGVPLTIIGAESGGHSLFQWVSVLARATALVLFRSKTFPQILVLEMGADHPGDITYLTDFVPCDIGVLTSVAPTHTEFFGTVENVLKEKSVLITHLREKGAAVLNADDERVVSLRPQTKAKVITYGYAEDATLCASDPMLSEGSDGHPAGLSFKMSTEGHTLPVFLPGVIGRHQVYAALAGVAVGLHVGLNLVQSSEALRAYRPPAGRMTLIKGTKETIVIDDSYNASPAAVHAALETIGTYPNAHRRIACLGDMAELGPLSDEEHDRVGKQAAGLQLDLLVTVGTGGKRIARAAEEAGAPTDHILPFDTSSEAGRFLQNWIAPGDVLLVKGSQVVRMEKIVKELMAEPERAGELLVRQGPGWR